MNLLLDNIDMLVKNKIKMEFNTDFRTSITFELLMQDPKYSVQAKTYQSLKLFYPNLKQVTDLEEAINNILWFYGCDNKNKTSQSNENKKEKQIYSYEFDNELIYSAFKNQYNIDLEETFPSVKPIVTAENVPFPFHDFTSLFIPAISLSDELFSFPPKIETTSS